MILYLELCLVSCEQCNATILERNEITFFSSNCPKTALEFSSANETPWKKIFEAELLLALGSVFSSKIAQFTCKN